MLLFLHDLWPFCSHSRAIVSRIAERQLIRLQLSLVSRTGRYNNFLLLEFWTVCLKNEGPGGSTKHEIVKVFVLFAQWEHARCTNLIFSQDLIIKCPILFRNSEGSCCSFPFVCWRPASLGLDQGETMNCETVGVGPVMGADCCHLSDQIFPLTVSLCLNI